MPPRARAPPTCETVPNLTHAAVPRSICGRMPQIMRPIRLREIKLPLDITLNPAVALLSLIALWGLIIWMYVRPEYNIGELWW
jgi:hypothetical protein